MTCTLVARGLDSKSARIRTRGFERSQGREERRDNNVKRFGQEVTNKSRPETVVEFKQSSNILLQACDHARHPTLTITNTSVA
jgi:hypothetical protein